MFAEFDIKIFTKLAIASMKSSIRAILTRIVHLKLNKLVSRVHSTNDALAYPMRSTRFLATIGMIVPPSDAPAETTPDANDLRLLNHCATMAESGQKIIPQANRSRDPDKGAIASTPCIQPRARSPGLRSHWFRVCDQMILVGNKSPCY